MKASKILKYSAYAIGEVILIVLGINIALHFDNKNKEEQTQQELQKVYTIISHDLMLDTASIETNLNFFFHSESVFQKVLSQEITKEEMETCVECQYLPLSYRTINFYNRGYKLLRNNAKFNSSQNDSLHGIIMEYYDYVANHMKTIQHQIITDAEDNVDYWKFNYDWYFDMETNPAFIDYTINDKEYLNMVKKHHFLIYRNYIPKLTQLKIDATNLLKRVEATNNSD